MQLIIAEKPSVAQSIAAVMGATEKRDGYIQGSGYLVSWCIGHLVGLAPAHDYDERYSKWRQEDLPILPGEWRYTVAAEWENALTLIAKGAAEPDAFMTSIESMTKGLCVNFYQADENKKGLFQQDKEAIGTCPRCGKSIYESKKNFYCSNRDCAFTMWKNDRFFESRKKTLMKPIAAALLAEGKAKIKGLYSEKTGKTYDPTVLLADTGGKYVNYRFEQLVGKCFELRVRRLPVVCKRCGKPCFPCLFL